ncbi:hypothetical protein [Conexibacter sp. DBS9H8]|uniref:hypothetical protein n=1 Tax=Conexibacter sp. DBS9H8 TaxID=2937801 RepID=UPI00200DE8A7|nr:hypothetical protein [Conexibacter sp. DBS9H8]
MINQTLKAMFGKSSPPPADQPGCGVQPRSDLGVRQSVSGVQHDPCSLHILKRKLLRPCDTLKLATLYVAEFDLVTGPPGHHLRIQPARPDSFT